MDFSEVGEDHVLGTHVFQANKVQVSGAMEREGLKQIPLQVGRTSDPVAVTERPVKSLGKVCAA